MSVNLMKKMTLQYFYCLFFIKLTKIFLKLQNRKDIRIQELLGRGLLLIL